jgi:hypothetical protein
MLIAFTSVKSTVFHGADTSETHSYSIRFCAHLMYRNISNRIKMHIKNMEQFQLRLEVKYGLHNHNFHKTHSAHKSTFTQIGKEIC